MQVIGQGSFGVVHRAIWRGMVVAAKVIPMVGSKDFQAARRELQAWQ